MFDGLQIQRSACSNWAAETLCLVILDNCVGFTAPAPKARACMRACHNLKHDLSFIHPWANKSRSFHAGKHTYRRHNSECVPSPAYILRQAKIMIQLLV